MSRINLLFFLYAAVIVGLFLYSFTQVDLSLTLTRFGFLQTIQQKFQYVGFFQRPLSTAIFSIVSGFLFLFYFIFLYLSKKNRLNIKKVWLSIIFLGLLLSFSYNAFSYDLFNYIFDAKIVTYYHQNPFIHKALDFPGDPMLSFMRWTHRLYPYGPSWLFLTVPLSFAGLNYLLPTFFLFKLLMGASYLGACFLIYKISEKLFPKEKLLNLSFFAFNPLVIIEGLVSSHNDMPMIFFTLAAIYLFVINKKLLSLLSYVFSIGIKYATIVLAPVFLWIYYMKRKRREIDWEKVFVYLTVLSLFGALIATVRTNFQPWYLLGSISFAAFVSKKYYIFAPFIILSIFGVLVYAPYVYLTDYNENYPVVVSIIESVGFAASAVTTLMFVLYRKRFKLR